MLTLVKATTFGARLRGLLFRRRLKENEGLWILPCNAVHTFGMRYCLDIVFLNRQGRVLEIKYGVPPQRIAYCLAAASAIELNHGFCLRNPTCFQPGKTFSSFNHHE